MKKLALIAVVVGLGLVLCGGESWAKGGSSGRSSGGSKGHTPGRGTGTSRTHGTHAGSKNHHAKPSTRGPGAHGGHRPGTTVRRTTRVGSEGDLSGTENAEAGFGMAIRELNAGTARKQGMKVGDIIMSVNGTSTPDFDSLRSALVQGGSRAEVDFINVDNGELERITLNPSGGAIGASVEQVQVD
jgi:hypothetical protein